MTKASIRSIILTLVLALAGGTAAVAATSGQIPLVPSAYFGADSVNSDGYPEHGQDVSAVARDKDATGTRTNPDGKVIENHGQAVREAAHDKGGDGSSDDFSDGASDDFSEGAADDASDGVSDAVSDTAGSDGPPAHGRAGVEPGNGGAPGQGRGNNGR